jgi:hypothetical protein
MRKRNKFVLKRGNFMTNLYDGFHIGVLGKKYIFKEGTYKTKNKVIIKNDCFDQLSKLINTYSKNATIKSVLLDISSK